MVEQRNDQEHALGLYEHPVFFNLAEKGIMKARKKLGLAFSGGGFRASLFHIGVLASLAEHDILKEVEVLSCVSGGSIIGAYYYLHLKELFEDKTDDQIDFKDYVEIVSKIEKDFFAEVGKNLRVKSLSSLRQNWAMLKDQYSISDRMAELYHIHFYERFMKKFNKDGDKLLSMSELIINPKGEADTVSIRDFNMKRVNKIPMLILNATTLNTGRNWQFTAVDMGERDPSEKLAGSSGHNAHAPDRPGAFDTVELLRSFRFDDPGKKIPEKYKKFPLGVAVASSACVPGLFTPLALTKLYENFTPQLVDGGVFDNQGISPIIYEECTDVIVSDASGQMRFFDEPRTDAVGVTKRANSALMNRIRNQGFEYLEFMDTTDAIDRKLMIHLREGIEQMTIDPMGRAEDYEEPYSQLTYYGINMDVQWQLSCLRTDLDSFTQVEAYSLMYSGYCMTNAKLEHEGILPKSKSEWRFLKAKQLCEAEKPPKEFLKQLEVGEKSMFKTLGLSKLLFIAEIFIHILAFGVALIPYILLFFISKQFFLYLLFFTLGMILILFLSSKISFFNSVRRFPLYKLSTWIITAFVAVSGWVISNLYLKFINKRFNKIGEIGALNRES